MSEYVNNPLLYFEHKCTDFKRETEKAIKKGLREGLKELRNTARQNLKSSVSSASKRNPKYNDTLVSGIRSYSPRRSKKNNAEITAAVKITSNRKKGSGSYRLPMLENGTVTRKTKKGYNRGSLKGYKFFQKANQSVSPQKVQSYIDREMQKALRELNEK